MLVARYTPCIEEYIYGRAFAGISVYEGFFLLKLQEFWVIGIFIWGYRINLNWCSSLVEQIVFMYFTNLFLIYINYF